MAILVSTAARVLLDALLARRPRRSSQVLGGHLILMTHQSCELNCSRRERLQLQPEMQRERDLWHGQHVCHRPLCPLDHSPHSCWGSQVRAAGPDSRLRFHACITCLLEAMQRGSNHAKMCRSAECRRFEREVLGGRLWFPACQAANSDLPEALPANFDSVDDYIAAFEALLFEVGL